jgi:predicted NACHT family NTPase
VPETRLFARSGSEAQRQRLVCIFLRLPAIVNAIDVAHSLPVTRSVPLIFQEWIVLALFANRGLRAVARSDDGVIGQGE